MRFRAIASELLFTAAAITGIMGVHKYIFGDFPKMWLVRDLPWHLVNPWMACLSSVVLAYLGARAARADASALDAGQLSSYPADATIAPGDAGPPPPRAGRNARRLAASSPRKRAR